METRGFRIFPAFGRQGEEDCEFEAGIGYVGRPYLEGRRGERRERKTGGGRREEERGKEGRGVKRKVKKGKEGKIS